MEKKITWRAKETQRERRTANWYWIFWSITLFLIFLIILIYKDYIFSGLIFVLGVLITLENLRKTAIYEYEIDDEKLINKSLKEETYFKNIEYYNIDKDDFKIILKEKGRKFLPKILSFEPNQNIKKMDLFLSTKIKKNKDYAYPAALRFINIILGI